MTAEIGGAKLLAPYYGSSLNVWSTVMAITLGGLAMGYFVGGKLSVKNQKNNLLKFILLFASVALVIIPFAPFLFIPIAKSCSLIIAVIISAFILLFIPMALFGAVSPLIISILSNNNNDDSGESSGKIYAISTVGGIVATFLCALILIPFVGIKNTFWLCALLLALSSLLLHQIKKTIVEIVICFSLFILLISFNKNTLPENYLTEQDGMFGKLAVKQDKSVTDSTIVIRKLLINNIVQTEMNIATKQSASDYINLLKRNLINFPKQGNVLVLGLGGGLVANLFHENKYQVDGVELDNRIIEVAKSYFYLNPLVKTFCDDARHYMNNCTKNYSIVLFDLFQAEEQPSHILTKESLVKLKSIISLRGIVLINWHGYLLGNKGEGTQCLLNTLKDAGFYYKICETNSQEDYRNLIIVASPYPIKNNFTNQIATPLITSTVINTDDKLVLEYLNTNANQCWRNNYLQNDILNRD